MTYQGVLKKMATNLAQPVVYNLDINGAPVPMNDVIDREMEIRFVGWQCLACGKKKKIFRQGYCYDCFYSRPETGDWVIRPELSKAHLGIEDRDLNYEKEAQLQPHVVYLAISGGVKVGVTRKSQLPTRWIDQGAVRALVIMETPNRYLAGITEAALKKHISDKTNWRRMLKNDNGDYDLRETRKFLLPYIPEETRPYIAEEQSKPLDIVYPVKRYPSRVSSLNLSKTSTYKGRLAGIKGQYWIFEDNTVFNVRSNEGTVVALTVL